MSDTDGNPRLNVMLVGVAIVAMVSTFPLLAVSTKAAAVALVITAVFGLAGCIAIGYHIYRTPSAEEMVQ